MTYRTPEEEESYRQRDPIQRFRRVVLEQGLLGEDELDAIDERVKREVDEAVRFAESSPFPAPEECLTDVYVSYPVEQLAFRH